MSYTINLLLVVALGLHWAGVGVMSTLSPWAILGAWVLTHGITFAFLYTLVSTGVVDVQD